ncbi:MAG: hypothetical protein ABIN97_07020 [Ginsengibacter sp.]
MLKNITTIVPSVAMQFYSEVIIKAMQEQEARMENQEAKIKALTQLVNKLLQNPDAVAEELEKSFLIFIRQSVV